MTQRKLSREVLFLVITSLLLGISLYLIEVLKSNLYLLFFGGIIVWFIFDSKLKRVNPEFLFLIIVFLLMLISPFSEGIVFKKQYENWERYRTRIQNNDNKNEYTLSEDERSSFILSTDDVKGGFSNLNLNDYVSLILVKTHDPENKIESDTQRFFNFKIAHKYDENHLDVLFSSGDATSIELVGFVSDIESIIKLISNGYEIRFLIQENSIDLSTVETPIPEFTPNPKPLTFNILLNSDVVYPDFFNINEKIKNPIPLSVIVIAEDTISEDNSSELRAVTVDGHIIKYIKDLDNIIKIQIQIPGPASSEVNLTFMKYLSKAYKIYLQPRSDPISEIS